MHPTAAARQGIARTFQNIALFKGMTVLDNIMTGRNTRSARACSRTRCGGAGARRGDAHRRKVEEVIDFLEIQAIRKTPVGRLPYGLQKRVELARALAAEPSMLLLDEPMAGMNVEEKQDMCRFILDVNDQFGTTIVLIEHDMGVVMDISDRVVVLDYGKKIGDGTPDEVKSNPDVIAPISARRTERPRALRGSGDEFLLRSPDRRPAVRRDVLAGGAGLRADLQGLRRVQLRAGRDGLLRRAAVVGLMDKGLPLWAVIGAFIVMIIVGMAPSASCCASWSTSRQSRCSWPPSGWPSSSRGWGRCCSATRCGRSSWASSTSRSNRS
jgi:ABC-type branched-subunit amino acid transport system ATPase component